MIFLIKYTNIYKSIMQKPSKIQAEKLIGTKAKDQVFQITDRDAIIYALGIGFSSDPLREQDFNYTYELSDNFTVFPTFAPCITKFDIVGPLMASPHMPQFSPFQILHAEQRLQMIHPKLISGAIYTSKQQIVDVLDKGKNALIIFRINSFVKNADGKEQLAFYNDLSMMITGIGGFGFKGKGVTKVLPKIPETKPDFVLKATSYPGQALLYRLSGDINPLHVDPNISSMQGFDKPIIHGLASYGIVARTIVQQLLNNDSGLLKSYHARFVGHVFPGQNYEIFIWKNGHELIFSVNVVERNKKVLIGSCQIRQKAKL